MVRVSLKRVIEISSILLHWCHTLALLLLLNTLRCHFWQKIIVISSMKLSLYLWPLLVVGFIISSGYQRITSSCGYGICNLDIYLIWRSSISFPIILSLPERAPGWPAEQQWRGRLLSARGMMMSMKMIIMMIMMMMMMVPPSVSRQRLRQTHCLAILYCIH